MEQMDSEPLDAEAPEFLGQVILSNFQLFNFIIFNNIPDA
jgi:hypothetical protein